MSHIYENDTKPILSDPPYLLQFILSVVLSVLCGATIMFMWNWFVVPLGLPMIGLVQALGLDTLITFMASNTGLMITPPPIPQMEPTMDANRLTAKNTTIIFHYTSINMM